jgi:calcineurin-like phosphoesterase family protein
MKFFTSDPHLGHQSIHKYRNIPEEIIDIDAWVINRLFDIPKGSDLYVLGDLAWNQEAFLKFLDKKPDSVQLHIIVGNHDNRLGNLDKYKRICSYHQYKLVKDLGHDFFLCHYPLKVWDKSHHNSINLYGHIHANTPQIKQEGRQLNVNCEFWDYRPLSSEFIINYLDGVDNWDYLEVKRRRA